LLIGDAVIGAFACLTADGGLALAFDVGIAKGSVSIAIALRYCPSVTISKNTTEWCLSILELGIVVDAEAVVVQIIHITIHAEFMATLNLAASSPLDMICKLTFRGYASIEVLFAKVEYDFEVNLDGLLGLHCSGTCSANMRLREEAELVAVLTKELDRHSSLIEVGA
jgi:hypothetical protein